MANNGKSRFWSPGKVLLALAVCAGVLAACSTSGTREVAPKTAGKVDLKRYQGTWYELARLPMFFQRNCVQSEAHYGVKPDGTVDVLNRCKTADGTWEEAHGTATQQVAGETDKLWVVFDNWFSKIAPGLTKGDYWIIDLDSGYNQVIVGTPDRKFLWLMSRTPDVSESVKEQMVSRAQQQGFDTSRLIWRSAD
ncbi:MULTISPECIES: lipocalin family protein [Pseudomonas]|uniref:Outer membrane lipoprotein Blc n=1 Tax=Pseudomonas quercus TaxID=2722792 RepID=A0ABX0YBG0_9PSED|nr:MULTISPECIES: lipocalin family protein [Pseudomonas]MBF7142165.1 lipocalin family protein [Pseudomonas sp. LY10J]NJP00703.1 lipocalin family protein [Pseudomonas quercus]